MNLIKLTMVLLATSCFAGCASIKSGLNEDEAKVPIASLPKAVTDTAAATLKGFTPTKACMENEDGRTIYELKGIVDGEKAELKITADGKLMRLERGEDD